jgi:hypothetical protein
MGNDEIADPLRQGRTAAGDRVISLKRLFERAPLRVREAHEDATTARVRHGRPSELRHGVPDITISGSDKGLLRGRDLVPTVLRSAARAFEIVFRSSTSGG